MFLMIAAHISASGRPLHTLITSAFSPSRFLRGSAFNHHFMIANLFSMGTVARKVVVGFEMWEIARECSQIKS